MSLSSRVARSFAPAPVRLLVPVVLALLSVGLTLPAFAAAAPLPDVAGLRSLTHPDQAKWYARSAPAFVWQRATGAAGYSWWLDAHPVSELDVLPETGPYGFASPRSFLSLGIMWHMAVADLDRDGDLDAVASDLWEDKVSVFLGDGFGGFSRTDHDSVQSPLAVAVDDFTGDGEPDVAVASNAGGVSIMAGDGTGAFTAHAEYPTSSGLYGIATSDFDADGDRDVVVCGVTGNAVTVLLNDGHGAFAARDPVAAGTFPVAVAAGDVDGDGKTDVVAAAKESDSVSILYGDGRGGLPTKDDRTVGDYPETVALGDFNEDGRTDIVAGNSRSTFVTVLLNGGGRTFSSTTSPISHGAMSLAVGDLDGDGHQDLAATMGGYGVTTLLGDGAGGFAEAGTGHTVANNPMTARLGDVDRDGRLDLVFGCYSAGSLSYQLNRTQDTAAAFGPRRDGVWYFHVAAVDGLGGIGSTSTCKVQIDTARPATRALTAASVRRGARATLKYRVDDARPGSPRALVTIQVKDARGKVVKRLKPGLKAVNTALSLSFTCALPKGRYSFVVFATDEAGNTQVAAGKGVLTVN